MRTLNVFIAKNQVGVLGEGDGIWRFTYDPQWVSLERSFDISPALPRARLEHLDGGSMRPVQWYFDNLLPEEQLRVDIAKEANIRDSQDAFALLEYLGAESTGSLTLLPPGQDLLDTAEYIELTDEELSGRIANLPRVTLTKGAPKRMSVAGAQHKLLVSMLGDKVFEPVGATPSTYILKPDHPQAQTYPASAFNEFTTMRMARAARLSIPHVALRYVPQPVYFIQRFDRRTERVGNARRAAGMPPVVHRLHVIDACQLLNKDRLFKHAGANLDALVAIIAKCTNKLATALALFRWLVFNIVVANDDSHLKNLSFFVDHEGVRMAPHYDLLCTGAYHTRALADEAGRWSDVKMTYALPGALTFREVTLASVVEAGQILGLPTKVAQDIVNDVATRVEREFAVIKKEHEDFASECPPARAAHYALEGRLLRVIEHITLKDMLSRLKTQPPA
ncbi:HipA domain-containing protein [Ideonella azotifigens]|uniref:Type II toxin-antitoxin system HipA family toxin n=1 Tax=Ideonella azotifigens TaxID=513160 RepID=A0ABN1K2A5_9BURK|nr:HipA domain-containing protein [Ideonella azotifigens]MCD2343810.1 HipA domain-containing protein [Ideonella azotifigens]